MPISINTTRSKEGTTLIEIAGEIDMLTAPTVRNAVYTEFYTGCPASLILDLSGVTFFGVTGLCVLLDARGLAAERRARLHLRRVPPSVTKVISLAGLGPVFATASTIGRPAATPASPGI